MDNAERAAQDAGETLSVEERVARLVPALRPVPAGGGIVCPRCRSAKGSDFDVCYPCMAGAGALGGYAVDVLPISLALAYGTLHDNLRQYKRAAADCVRYRAATTLGSLVVAFLKAHKECLGPWDIVATVPSRNNPTNHPLQQLVGRILKLRDDFEPLVECRPGWTGGRTFAPDRFQVQPGVDLTGVRVLLLDDTFTTGSSIQSAAYTLAVAGAEVTALVIGRYIDPQRWAPSKDLLATIADVTWTVEACGLCRPVPSGATGLFG